MADLFNDLSGFDASPDPDGAPGLEIIDQHLTQLKEHFDSVEIFATRRAGPNTTEHFHLGRGDIFARYGLIRMWLITQERHGLSTGPGIPDDQK